MNLTPNLVLLCMVGTLPCCRCSREQLGGNKYLVTDGLFMAKSLGRTFVEYPVKDARWAKCTCR